MKFISPTKPGMSDRCLGAARKRTQIFNWWKAVHSTHTTDSLLEFWPNDWLSDWAAAVWRSGYLPTESGCGGKSKCHGVLMS